MQIEEPRRLARLDEAGGHVLCGSQYEGIYRCSREIGPILDLALPPPVLGGRLRLVLDPEPDYARARGVALRAFEFPVGWEQRRDGVWDRYGREGGRLRYAHYAHVVTWWRRVTHWPRPLLAMVHADRPPPVVELPARVVCQRCRTISLLTAERLRVSAPLPTARLAPPA